MVAADEAQADHHTDDRVLEADRTDGEADRSDYVYRTRFGQRTERGPTNPRRQIRDDRGFFRVAPLLGATGLYGDVSFNDRRADVDAGPTSTAGNFDLVAGVDFEIGYRNVGLMADFRHFDMTTDDVDIDGNQGSLDLENFISNVAMHWTYSPLEMLQLGPVAGFRHYFVRAGSTDSSRSAGSEQWLDPIVGMRGRLSVADIAYLEYYGDAGGIGYGSEITWQGYGGVGVSVGNTDFELGYRALYADYEEDDFDYDLLQAGPTFKTRFNF